MENAEDLKKMGKFFKEMIENGEELKKDVILIGKMTLKEIEDRRESLKRSLERYGEIESLIKTESQREQLREHMNDIYGDILDSDRRIGIMKKQIEEAEKEEE